MSQPLILHIETAAPICSVSIARDVDFIASKVAENPNSHAKLLAPLIQQLLSENNFSLKDLHAVAVSEGPGSYTGLRIGLSTAKGICYAMSLPLILINTLQAMAVGMKAQSNTDLAFLPVLDARRNDVYWNVFNQALQPLTKTDCNNIDEVIQFIHAEKLNVIVAGTGAFKFPHQEPTIQILEVDVISSSNMKDIALEKYHANDFADLAYSEPVYRI